MNKITKELASIISIIANLVLAALKLVLGFIFKSSALVAEGIHSGMDIVSSLVVYGGMKIAKREADKKHPYGWGRVESLTALVVVAFLGFGGIGVIWDAGKEILFGQAEPNISPLLFLTMIFSVFVNEFLARMKITVGQREESLALIADGKHEQADVLSSVGVLLGLGFARFFPIADSLTALGVGLLILRETYELGQEVTENLLDTADLEAEEKIKKICKKEQVDLSDLKTRKIGPRTFAELEITLPQDVKLSRADDLMSELENKLIQQVKRLEYVIIQLKGQGKRRRLVRGKCAQVIDRLGPAKKGKRVIIPSRQGEPYQDFGAPEYRVIDYQDGKKVCQEIIKNPYYKIGRGHGVRFARAVGADEVKTKEIGKNAQKALKNLGIKTGSRD